MKYGHLLWYIGIRKAHIKTSQNGASNALILSFFSCLDILLFTSIVTDFLNLLKVNKKNKEQQYNTIIWSSEKWMWELECKVAHSGGSCIF